MNKRKWLSYFLTGALAISLSIPVAADTTEEKITDVQSQRQETQSSLSQTEEKINTLQEQKRSMEAYLNELNAKYVDLTRQIEELDVQEAQKNAELKQTKDELQAAEKKAQKQYKDMKLRISYMYENGNSSYLDALLSSVSFGEMLSRAENIRQLSAYDQEMLDAYEAARQKIEKQEEKLQNEEKELEALQKENQGKQQEVQELVDTTSENITAYANEISSSQQEAAALVEELTSQEQHLNELLQAQAAENEAARRAREEAQAQEAQQSQDQAVPAGDGENDMAGQEAQSGEENDDTSGEVDDLSEEESEDWPDSASEDTDTDVDSGDTAGANEGSGTYLGNFKLTAYCNCAQCCGSAGNQTASGTWPAAGRTVAMAGVPFGTQLLINGNVYTVEDLGTPYGHVDIYFNSHAEALSFGLQYADVYRLN